MANWLLDYIEMTEYIPAELREQLTSIRELDLQVHNAMDELEKDLKQFFSKLDTLTPSERQEQYEAFMKKCDVATRAASDKVIVADKLHDLVEKSMRLLDQGLEKLKEELLEGDKAYIVEDLERRSLEQDEQTRLEHENMLQQNQRHQQTSKSQMLKTQSKGSNNHHHHHHNHRLSSKDSSSSKSNQSVSQNNHRNSLPAQSNNNNNNNLPSNHQHNHHLNTNHRNRNNSTGTQNSTPGTQKKRERKRLNSAMTIFNRNSRIDDEDSTTSQSFLSSPMTPDYLVGMQNSNKSLNDVVVGPNNCNLTLKGMVTSDNRISIGATDKSNGKGSLVGAKQPILTAIDAAHAVSPNATNSDKLVLFSNNANGDNYDATLHHNPDKQHQNNTTNPPSANQLNPSTHQLQHHNQLSNHLLSKVGFNSGDSTLINNSIMPSNKGDALHSHHSELSNHKPFPSLPLSSRHDPIMMAASQAISATQNMTSGRRTSSLKASYAAVNSGRLQTPANHQMFDPGVGLVHEVYCKCRSHIQGSDMIACDNEKCKIEWFHWQCVGITTPPEGEWYCDECRISLGIHNQRGNKQPKLEGVNVT